MGEAEHLFGAAQLTPGNLLALLFCQRRPSSESVQQKTQRETGGMSPLRKRQRGAQNRYSCAGTVLCALRELRFHSVRVEPERRYGKLEQIEQEGENMKSKCCVGCKWHEEWTWACFNGDSPYCADFVNCGCPLYEEKETNDKKGTDSL